MPALQRPKPKLTIQMATVARMFAEGKTVEEIARCVYDVRTEDGVTTDEAKLKKALYRVRRMQAEPAVLECYRKIIREAGMTNYARAMNRISKQIDSNNEWLANKAANDTLTRFGPAVMGEEDHEVVVRIEGMPELGTPDGADEE